MPVYGPLAWLQPFFKIEVVYSIFLLKRIDDNNSLYINNP